jgi:hypothetical protein
MIHYDLDCHRYTPGCQARSLKQDIQMPGSEKVPAPQAAKMDEVMSAQVDSTYHKSAWWLDADVA